MSFGNRVLAFNRSLRSDWVIPQPVGLLYPYDNEDTWQAMQQFYDKYYADEAPRIGIFGINPGRFGAAVTGVPFTDPKRLLSECGIDNPFPKKPELSSEYVYKLVNDWGGPTSFYETFYISSVCPLGFIKDGKNYNYYDDKKLEKAVEPHIVDHLKHMLQIGVSNEIAFCLGIGKNWKYLSQLNSKHALFEEIIPLPHPRWVMQYKRKRVDEFAAKSVAAFRNAKRQIFDAD
jgi:hypothetical protein